MKMIQFIVEVNRRQGGKFLLRTKLLPKKQMMEGLMSDLQTRRKKEKKEKKVGISAWTKMSGLQFVYLCQYYTIDVRSSQCQPAMSE